MSGLLLAFLKRDLRIARTYRAAFFGQLAGVLLFLATFALMSPVVRGDFEGSYGAPYVAYAAVGIAVSGALLGALDAFSGSLREAQLDGTLEAVFLTPAPHTRVVALLGAWPLAVGFAGTALTIAVTAGVSGGFNVHPLTLLIVLALSAGAFGAFGLLAAANPMTYALDAWRGALLDGLGPTELLGPLAALLAMCVIGVPPARSVLRRCVDLARTDGTLCAQ